MKNLVYLINCGYSLHERGIIKKVISQKEAFERLGYTVYVYQLNRYKPQLIDFHTMAFTGGEKALTPIKNKLSTYYKSMKDTLRDIEQVQPDFIYVRDAMWFFNLYSKLSVIAPVFVEIQTNIINELKVAKGLRYYLERTLKRSYFKNTSGLITITQEIGSFETRFNKKPLLVLGNGVDRDDIKFTKREGENGLINLIFIGSPGEAWHGLERLIHSFLNAKNQNKFMLHIVGVNNIYNVGSNSIRFYGFISDLKRLDELFSIADIGVGTLALYRKGMNEAAPLKVRHYMSRGLPVIIGYDDADLKGSIPFVFHVPNDDSLIDFLKLEKFYDDSKMYRESGCISEFAYENLIWDKKLEGVTQFMERHIKRV